MAGHDDGNGIARAGHADRARSRAQRHRHAAIGRGLAVRDLAHHRPDALLEVGAARGERQVEALELGEEVAVELARRPLEERAGPLVAAALAGASPAHAGHGVVIRFERETTNWCIDVTNGHMASVASAAGFCQHRGRMSGGDKVKGRRLGRRALLGGAAALAPALALAQQPPRPAPAPGPPRRQPVAESGLPPIVFVHGNGDSSALWINNIWRFEANGYKRRQLFAIDLAYPNARRDDSKPEPFRSSAEDQMKELAAFVAQVVKTTRRRKVALVGSSRGGNAIRSYLKNGGGAEYVSHAVLCGTPTNGIE